jgi:hypothetical protein
VQRNIELFLRMITYLFKRYRLDFKRFSIFRLICETSRNDQHIMGKNQLKGKHLRQVDFPSDIAKSVAINTMSKHYKFVSLDEKLEIIKNVLGDPEALFRRRFT